MSGARLAGAPGSYDIHDVGLLVTGAPDDVAGALEWRLRGFATTPAPPPDIRLKFVEDLADSGVALPAEGSRTVYDTPDGEVVYFPDADVLAAELAGVHMHVDLRGGTAHIASARFTGRRRYVAAHPLSTLALIELLERRGRYHLHAACLARDGSGVLLAGTSGAGKSTLALALARAGLDYLSDDMIFLSAAGALVTAHGFADAVGVTDGTRARFPELAGAEAEPGFPKALVRIEDAFDVRVTPTCEPRVVVFPEIVGGAVSRLEPLPREEAWLRLLPDVLVTDPDTTQRHMQTIATLTEQADCHRLLFGGDIDAAARLVAELV